MADGSALTRPARSSPRPAVSPSRPPAAMVSACVCCGRSGIACDTYPRSRRSSPILPFTNRSPACRSPPRCSAPLDGARPMTATGGFLFTHRGYSGPRCSASRTSPSAPASRAARSRSRCSRNGRRKTRKSWRTRPARRAGQRRRQRLVVTRLRQHLPSRLADWLTEDAGVSSTRRSPPSPRPAAAPGLAPLSLSAPPGPQTRLQKAEVTGGGLALDEVDPRTLRKPSSSPPVLLRRAPRRLRPHRRPQLRLSLGHRPPGRTRRASS